MICFVVCIFFSGGVVFGLLYCLTYPCRALCCGKRFTPKYEIIILFRVDRRDHHIVMSVIVYECRGYKPPKVLIVGAGAVGQVC